MTPAERAGFAGVLATAMAVSTFALAVLAVLSGELLEEFGLARWQLGAVVTSIAVVGAVLSPALGRVADRVGGRRALSATFVLSAASLAAIGLAPSYLLLLLAGMLAGVAQAVANPATNKLISAHLDAGRRGVVTGIKQSGVQVGVSVGGILLPLGALALGWRVAVLIAAAVPLIGLLAVSWVVPAPAGADPASAGEAGGDHRTDVEVAGALDGAQRRYVLLLAVYGLLLGAGWSGAFTYLADYARAEVGLAVAVAGVLVTVVGLAGVAGRLAWNVVAERALGSPRTLALLGVLAAAGVGGLALAAGAPWLLWPSAALLGLSGGAWNAVGMLAVIEALPTRAAGAGSGTVLLGFLSGLAVGAPLFGWSVDLTSAYLAGFLGSGALFAGGALVARAMTVPVVADPVPVAAE